MPRVGNVTTSGFLNLHVEISHVPQKVTHRIIPPELQFSNLILLCKSSGFAFDNKFLFFEFFFFKSSNRFQWYRTEPTLGEYLRSRLYMYVLSQATSRETVPLSCVFVFKVDFSYGSGGLKAMRSRRTTPPPPPPN